MSSEIVVVLSTLPAQQAEVIIRTLVEERLTACVNTSAVQSTYRWDGKLHQDAEVLAFMKTTAARSEALCRRLRELHPNQVPEILVLRASGGHLPYLNWVEAETRPQ